MQKKIPFREIDRAITVNCAIDYKSNKALQFPKLKGITNQGLGRCIFIYIALQTGYDREEICDYLAMNVNEFDQKEAVLGEMYAAGKILFEGIEPGEGIEYGENHLLFYRKLLLARNYLRYRFEL